MRLLVAIHLLIFVPIAASGDIRASLTYKDWISYSLFVDGEPHHFTASTESSIGTFALVRMAGNCQELSPVLAIASDSMPEELEIEIIFVREMFSWGTGSVENDVSFQVDENPVRVISINIPIDKTSFFDKDIENAADMLVMPMDKLMQKHILYEELINGNRAEVIFPHDHRVSVGITFSLSGVNDAIQRTLSLCNAVEDNTK